MYRVWPTGWSPLYMPNHFSVWVTMEVRLHRFAAGVNRGGEAGKILGYVAQGGEIENGGLEPLRPGESAQKILKWSALVKP